MINIGLFFGSDEGNTQAIAGRIAERLGVENVDVYDIADVTQADFERYSHIILGISTWDFGQIQSDWEEFWGDVESIDFSGKTVALFGLGDQFGYGNFFVDAMGMLHDVVKQQGANIVGHWPIAGYEFEASKALIKGQDCFVGLAIDEDQQSALSDARLDAWCAQIHQEMDLQTELYI
ncbi:MAG: flavodoxin [Marinagarivorans sp.]|nr:flavodoxin [Marinagarivorans sp.]